MCTCEVMSAQQQVVVGTHSHVRYANGVFRVFSSFVLFVSFCLVRRRRPHACASRPMSAHVERQCHQTYDR